MAPGKPESLKDLNDVSSLVVYNHHTDIKDHTKTSVKLAQAS